MVMCLHSLALLLPIPTPMITLRAQCWCKVTECSRERAAKDQYEADQTKLPPALTNNTRAQPGARWEWNEKGAHITTLRGFSSVSIRWKIFSGIFCGLQASQSNISAKAIWLWYPGSVLEGNVDHESFAESLQQRKFDTEEREWQEERWDHREDWHKGFHSETESSVITFSQNTCDTGLKHSH